MGIKVNPNYENFYYDLACIKAILNDKESAINYLEKFLQLNKNSLSRSDIERESSFKNILNNKKFKSLLKKYFN